MPGHYLEGSSHPAKKVLFDASSYSSIYSNDCKTVQPPAITVNYCIQAKKTNNSSGGTGSDCNCPTQETIQGWIDDKIKNINPGGLSIGTIFSHVSSKAPAGAHLLDGHTITKKAYSEFWTWLEKEMGEMVDTPLYKSWTMPSLTADGTLGGDTYAAEASAAVVNGYNAYKSFDGTHGGANTFAAIAKTTSGSLTFYSPVKLKVTSLLFKNSTSSVAKNLPVTFEIFGSNNGTDWTSLVSGNYESTVTSATQEVHIPESKYDVTNVGYEYFKIYVENGGGTNIDFPEITIYGQEYYRTAQVSNGFIRVIDAKYYEEEIAEYDFCGAFVVTENDIQLPDYRNAFLMGGDASNKGTAIAAGLPDHSHSYSALTRWGMDPGGAAPYWCRGDSGGSTATGYFTNASESNPIYGNSDTVQPPTICVNYYIQVSNSTYTSSNVEAAVKDLSNVTAPTQTFKDMSISWVIPDYTAGITIDFPLSANPYIAPCDGVFVSCVQAVRNNYYLYINGTKSGYVTGSGGDRFVAYFCNSIAS